MAVLVIVPMGAVSEEYELLSAGMLVLDDVLMVGAAGVYFRRLRMAVALSPEKRGEYDRRRREYLRCIVPQMMPADGNVVVVGTHPSDVDLMEYSRVVSVNLSAVGLKELSMSVYGDPMMSSVEHLSVMRAVGDSVDDCCELVAASDVVPMIVRQYAVRTPVLATISAAAQRTCLAGVLADEPNAAVWMEDEIRVDSAVTQGFMLADWDYLRVVKPRWRDAVARLLGSAPSVALVMRLPWFAVKMGAVSSLCYRRAASGLPAVSSRGRSLVEFVKTRLAGEMSVHELVGTWVGTLLCDSVTAMDTARVLVDVPLVDPVGAVSVPAVSTAATRYVPSEFLWMFSAVPGVRAMEWTGARRVDGVPVVSAADDPVLAVASLYSEYAGDKVMRAEVVQLVYRLVMSMFGEGLSRQLHVHAQEVMTEGPVQGVFNSTLTCMLPGYTYLYDFPWSLRREVADKFGSNPALRDLAAYAASSGGDFVLPYTAIVAEHVRLRLMAGVPLRAELELFALRRDYSMRDPGYCYLELFHPAHRLRMSVLLGAYPRLRSVLDTSWERFWDVTASAEVHVRATSGSVLHFSRDNSGSGVPLALFLTGDMENFCPSFCANFKVGADVVDVCSDRTALIVVLACGWTIVLVAVVIFFARLIRDRCGGNNRRGGGGYYR